MFLVLQEAAKLTSKIAVLFSFPQSMHKDPLCFMSSSAGSGCQYLGVWLFCIMVVQWYPFVTWTYLHLPNVIDKESLPMCFFANSESCLVSIGIFGTFLHDIVFPMLNLECFYMFWIALFNETHPLTAFFSWFLNCFHLFVCFVSL